ncbi:MAG: hypothetical protein FWD11_00335 [Micrococcales bacterium]|nr:hypothetical protein [Micrococcales bacterium]
MTRDDLMALTEAVLVSVTNKGLVNRAGKLAPSVQVTVADDGSVIGTVEDATVTLPPGAPLDQTQCTCPAPGVCRHRVATVLAYQAQAGTESEASAEAWDPAEITDAQLTDLLGARAVTAARTMSAGGLAATVHRGTVPRVDLPTASVRFLVPHDVTYATSDAKDPRLVALAVWACRAATAKDPAADQVRVEVRPARAATTGYPQVVETLDRLLATGVMHLGPGFGLAASRRSLTGLQWPLDGLDDLTEQLDAYTARHATHDELRTADVLAELYARHRCVRTMGTVPIVPPGDQGPHGTMGTVPFVPPGQGSADGVDAHGVIVADVLGTEVAPSTPCARLRLVGLGARVHARPSPDDLVTFDAQIYLADAASGLLLVLPHQWVGGPDTVPAQRRVAGTTLGALALSNVITESAHRSASRMLRLARSKVAPTSVLPLGPAWGSLPANLLVDDYADTARRLAQLPPRYVRPRVAAELVRVLTVAEVADVAYHPGDQRLTAQLVDPHGICAQLVCDYNPTSPGGLDAVAHSLGDPDLRWVAGHVSRRDGRLMVRPTAVWSPSSAVAVDLVTDNRHLDLNVGTSAPSDVLDEAISAGLTALAVLAHRGLTAPGPAALDRVAEASAALTRCGLTTTATAVAQSPTAPTAWVDAMVWLTVAAESR